MSTLFIKGMKMPHDCFECPLALPPENDDDPYWTCCGNGIKVHEAATEEHRPYKCPLVEVDMKVENVYNPWQEPNFSAPQGWVCPKCGRVYSPTTPMCFYCGSEDHITISTTGTQPQCGDRSWAFKGDSKEESVEK